MKKKLFVVVVLAALMLLASLSTSTAGIWQGFTGYTNGLNSYVLLKQGVRADYPTATRAAVRVNESILFNPSKGSICFYSKIEAQVGDNQWEQVSDAVYCYNADQGMQNRLTWIPYYNNKVIPNNTALRLYGRSGQYHAGEPMRGNINFN